jgi:hypothetical protein
VGERIGWYGVGLVERVLDLPVALAEASRRAAERFRHARSVVAESLLEIPLALGEHLASLRTRVRDGCWRCIDRAADLWWALRRDLFRRKGTVQGQSQLAVPDADLERHRLAELRLELTVRQAGVTAAEARLESRRQQLDRTASVLAAREASLAERQHELDQRQKMIVALELQLAREMPTLTNFVGRQQGVVHRESEWWEKQLGRSGRRGAATPARNRSRFDPAVAAALRRSRAERRGSA